MLFAMAEHLELPRPWRLTLTAGWNLAESLGLPVAGYFIGAKLGGRDVGMLAATGVVWLTVAGRKVFTRTTIMERVWGYDFDPESNILEVYINFLRKKLDRGHDRKLLHTVRGVGFRLARQQESAP